MQNDLELEHMPSPDKNSLTSPEMLIYQVNKLTKSLNGMEDLVRSLNSIVERQGLEIGELQDCISFLRENCSSCANSLVDNNISQSSDNDLSQSNESLGRIDHFCNTVTSCKSTYYPNQEKCKENEISTRSMSSCLQIAENIKIPTKGGEYQTHTNLISEMDASSLIEMNPGEPWPKVLNLNLQQSRCLDLDGTYEKWLICPKYLTFNKLIGRGSSALVYQGKYKNNVVAIKVLNFNPLDSRSLEKQQKELAEEVNVMKNVSSKHVVHLHGIVLEPAICIVMEYCESGSLYDVLKRRERIGWSAVLRIFKEIARGVSVLHKLRPPVVHRDLKTLNILMTKDMKVKVADFGLSRLSEAENHCSTLYKLRGTHTYCAPEVYNGEQYTEKADIYSLGIILWELVYRCYKGEYQRPFGEYPWINYSFQVIIQTAKNGLRPTIPPCPEKIKNLICSLWVYNPAKRPDASTLLAIVEELERKYHENRREWHALCNKSKEFKDIQAPPDLPKLGKDISRKHENVAGKIQKNYERGLKWVTKSISERKERKKTKKIPKFDDLLSDERLYKSFLTFLRKELCDEYLRFWKELKQYLEVPEESMVIAATDIYTIYLLSEVVAIDPKQMKVIANRIDDHDIDINLFENVRYEVESILKTKFSYFSST